MSSLSLGTRHHPAIFEMHQWSGRYLGTTGWYPSVCKSNRLHVDILRVSFIKLGYIILIIPLKWSVIFLQSWTNFKRLFLKLKPVHLQLTAGSPQSLLIGCIATFFRHCSVREVIGRNSGVQNIQPVTCCDLSVFLYYFGDVPWTSLYGCVNDRGEPAVSYRWTGWVLRNNWLKKFKSAGNLPTILEEFTEYTQFNNGEPKDVNM